jgi:hypothetical protein
VTLPLFSAEEGELNLFEVAEVFSLRALGACIVHRCVHPREWEGATAFSDPFGSGYFRCTFVNKRLLIESDSTMFRLHWVRRFLEHDAEQKREIMFALDAFVVWLRCDGIVMLAG